MTGIESHDHMLIDVAWHRFAAKFPIDTKGMQKCCIEQLKLLHYLQKFCAAIIISIVCIWKWLNKLSVRGRGTNSYSIVSLEFKLIVGIKRLDSFCCELCIQICYLQASVTTSRQAQHGTTITWLCTWQKCRRITFKFFIVTF